MDIIFASGNLNKLAEIEKLTRKDQLNILSLKDIGFIEDIEETGNTLEDNALIKARYIAQQYDTPVFAEDSGLEIEALGGQPGVHTARYAGENKDPDKNMDKVLTELAGNPNRSARFRAVICLIFMGKEHIFEGVVHGMIATKKMGNAGFGYDPIFIPENFDKTFAQLPASAKNQLSHRARAFLHMQEFLISTIKHTDPGSLKNRI